MTDEMLSVSRLERQLIAAGVARIDAIPTAFTYIAALADGTNASWEAFYRSVFLRLSEIAQADYPQAGRAAEPLLRLIDDDFGANLFSEAERKRIRMLLVEDGAREASLPS